MCRRQSRDFIERFGTSTRGDNRYIVFVRGRVTSRLTARMKVSIVLKFRSHRATDCWGPPIVIFGVRMHTHTPISCHRGSVKIFREKNKYYD